jgi:hypothetical protein
VFFLIYKSASSETGEAGNITTLINSSLMAKHCLRLEWTGDEEEMEPSLAEGCGDFVTEIWNQWTYHAAGVIADKQHLYCPPGESRDFYRGWLSCCTWLTGNAANNIEIKRERPEANYHDIVIEIVRSYLSIYEQRILPGTAGFWMFVSYYLRREFGDDLADLEYVKFDRPPPHSFEDMMGAIKFLLEFDDEVLDSIRDLVNSYPDRETGYQVALLKLRSEFMFTGKFTDEIVMVNATRIPPG